MRSYVCRPISRLFPASHPSPCSVACPWVSPSRIQALARTRGLTSRRLQKREENPTRTEVRAIYGYLYIEIVGEYRIDVHDGVDDYNEIAPGFIRRVRRDPGGLPGHPVRGLG